MLVHMSEQKMEPPQPARHEAVPVAACPSCGFLMVAIRGSKDAVCTNCGFKDSCCY